MPTPSDWLLILGLPGLFLLLGLVLLVVLRRAFRQGDSAPSPSPLPPSRRALSGITLGIVLAGLAILVALAALFIVVWNARGR